MSSSGSCGTNFAFGFGVVGPMDIRSWMREHSQTSSISGPSAFLGFGVQGIPGPLGHDFVENRIVGKCTIAQRSGGVALASIRYAVNSGAPALMPGAKAIKPWKTTVTVAAASIGLLS